MKKPSPPKNKYYSTRSLMFVALFASLTSLTYLYTSHSSQKGLILSIETRKMPLPAQYSDTHITQNAIDSNPKFRHVALLDTESMLANSISALPSSGSHADNLTESGTWLWTPILQLTPNYRTSIIEASVKNGIKNIYLSIDSYLDIYIMPDGPDKLTKKKMFDQNVEEFIAQARENNITVDAEAGWRNWAEDGNAYKAFATINYAKQFNKTHTEKFRSFQYDVEPYLLDSYEENKAATLKNYLTLVDQSVTLLNKSDLRMSVVIPEFYDGTHSDTPLFSYKGKKGYVIDHLLSILDRRAGSSVILMSYRNWSTGENGSIDISKNEITAGNSHSTKIIVAAETGEVEPSYVTFYNMKRAYYSKQAEQIKKAFSGEKSFGGLAVHYINAFMDLK